MKARPTNRRFAFTLVEMLVVIAVIVILAGITLPVVMRAQTIGRRTSCANNLNQIGKGLYMYANNHNRYFPCNRAPAPISFWVGPPPFERGFDSLSILYGVPVEIQQKTGEAEPEKITVETTKFVPEIRVFNCPSTRDRCGTVEESEWWKEIRLKRTGKKMKWDEGSRKWNYVPPDPPKPKLSYEYCGEFNPSLQYSRISTRLAWLAHDEDARNENTQSFQTTRDATHLQLYEKSNHRTRGGNVLFVDGRVDWVTAIQWPQTILRGIEEWERVTGWKLPAICYAPDE